MYRQIAKLKRGVEELMMRDMQKQITKLTHQLMEAGARGIVRRVITDQWLILRTCFRGISRRNKLMINDVEIESFDDSNSFLNWNHPPKIDLDGEMMLNDKIWMKSFGLWCL